jgi:hypothetical protein
MSLINWFTPFADSRGDVRRTPAFPSFAPRAGIVSVFPLAIVAM